MDRSALLDRIVERDRRIAALQAEQLADVACFAGDEETFTRLRVGTERGERVVTISDVDREELACALRLTSAAAHRLIDTARLLAGPLPGTREAMASGIVSLAHVASLVEAAHDLQDDAAACAELERRVLGVAERSTAARTRAAARRAVLVIDPPGYRRRRDAALRARDVMVVDSADGLATLIARMSRMQARSVVAAVQAHSVECPGSTAGERRANALVGLVLGQGGTSTAGSSAPRPAVTAAIDVLIDLDTLLGLRDDPVDVGRAGVAASTEVRALLADPAVGVTLRRLVADPLTGQVLDRGRTAYEPSASLCAFIVSRDRTCRFPACGRRAEACDLDHAVPWAEGGGTDRANLGALCRRHHVLKTHAGWALRRREDDSVEWRSPLGRHYVTEPPHARTAAGPAGRARPPTRRDSPVERALWAHRAA
jgi:hypothetical protein